MHHVRCRFFAASQVIAKLSAAALAWGVMLVMMPVPAQADPGNFPGTTAAKYQVGNDISWPQCPPDSRYANPMPPAWSGFVIIGLTHGRPFTSSPCFAEHVAWTRARHKPMQFYTMSGYPSTAQVNTYGASGPFKISSYLDRLRNTGYAAARFDVTMMRSKGVTPNRIWIDIEHSTRQPWPSANGDTAIAARNRAVIEGMLRYYYDARIYSGFYSNADSWKTIMNNWHKPGVPFWATVGTRGQATAINACRSRGLNGGVTYMAQWWDTQYDWNIACPGHIFTS